MPPIFCKYHRNTRARHHCPDCGFDLCKLCAKPFPVARDEVFFCPVCNGELESLGIANTIQPFWKRIPRFFIYPAHPKFLVYILLLALSSMLTFLPFLGFSLYLLIIFIVLKYAYLVLEDTAKGNQSPSFAVMDKLEEGNTRPLMQLFIFLIMGTVILLLGKLDPLMGLAAFLFVLFSIPASVISMAIEEDFGRALNPIHLATIMREIGAPYVVLWISLLLLSSGTAVVKEIIFPYLNSVTAMVVGTFFSSYLTLSLFHFMGYVVYQYHEELGYDDGIKEFSETRSRAPTADDHPVLNEVKILMAEGRMEAAKGCLATALATSNEIDLHERYHELLLALGCHGEFLSHGRNYISVLFDLNELTRAVEVLTACVKADPGFELGDPELTYVLARHASDMQRYDLVLKTLGRFAQRFPGDPDIPAAYLLAARVLCDHKQEFAQAKRILTSLVRIYPQHPLGGEIDSCLKRAESLERSSTGHPLE